MDSSRHVFQPEDAYISHSSLIMLGEKQKF